MHEVQYDYAKSCLRVAVWRAHGGRLYVHAALTRYADFDIILLKHAMIRIQGNFC